MKITLGVPQGSVLCPLLFLICIKDLARINLISNKLKFCLFANDIDIYFDCNDIRKLVNTESRELKFVKKWVDASKLSINTSKTNYIIFTPQLCQSFVLILNETW